MSTSVGQRSPPHLWKFSRLGGLDQVRLETADDLRALGQLDQKLWVALSCPVRGLEFDEATLALIDGDRDGHIRAPEIIAAVQWCDQYLKDLGIILHPAPTLPLAAINDQIEEGRLLLVSARQVLAGVGRPQADQISLADVLEQQLAVETARFNGDGVITAATMEDDRLRQVVKEIVATVGGVADRSGESGADGKKIEAFFSAIESYLAWRDAADAPGPHALGPAPAMAFNAFAAVATKVDDFFVRTSLAAFDVQAAGALNGVTSDLAAWANKNLAVDTALVEQLPLAPIAPGLPLPLAGEVNPAWAARLSALAEQTVAPLLGSRTELTRTDWQAIKDRLAPYAAWYGRKAGTEVESLGVARLRELAASSLSGTLTELVKKDAAFADLDRLLRYHRDLYRLLNNFVSFFDFYAPEREAIFQAGTLYLDARSCHLCVRVNDMNQHAKFADLSRTYLVYCECTRPGRDKIIIAAGITGGDADNLMPGRNGLFYDRAGCDWDARIVKIVENPISIHQAIWSPYKRIASMIGTQIGKFAADWNQNAVSRAEAGLTATTSAPAPQRPAPFDVAKFAGIFAAIGLALGAIGSALAAVASGFLRLAPWKMPLMIIGILVLISGPSVLLAAMKLRLRNLGPILDANGWAVNARVKINIPFGGTLTQIAVLPPGARRSFEDPYADNAGLRTRFYFLLVALLLADLAFAKIAGTWPFH